jgi:hypothetical protein
MVSPVPEQDARRRAVNPPTTGYRYAARDQDAAEAIADEMAAFGYAEVAARPTQRRYLLDRGMGWELMVTDDTSYSPGITGDQEMLAVNRRARAIARAHGGFALGTISPAPPLLSPEPPVMRYHPGSAPVVPPIPKITVPALGDLALEPDTQPLLAPRLEELGAVRWGELGCEEVPALISGLFRDGWERRLHELMQGIMPNDTCQPGTGPAVTILARLLLGNAFTAVRRSGVYSTLIRAAGQYTEEVISGADIVAATGRPPRSRQWSEAARDAVGAEVTGLLARWDIEPPANRVALATLAAVYRVPGQVLADRIAALAAALEGSRVGYCARIAHQLIAGNFEAAAREAASMSLWDEESRIEYDFDNELIEPSMLAGAVLSNQVLQLLPW